MDPTASSNLEEQIRALQWRVYRLEETLRNYGIVDPQEAVQPRAVHPSVEQEAPQAPAGFRVEVTAAPLTPEPVSPAVAPVEFAEASSHEESRSLESRIGSQWFNRIGILAMLIGTAWFLKLAIDNHWIGPLGRVLIGLAAGAGLIAWSERFYRRGYAVFAYSLKAVGSGILY